MTAAARRGLEYSLNEYGDLSGIVFNQKTGELIGAHQRIERIRAVVGDVEIIPDTTEPDAAGDLWGHVAYKQYRFPVRIVDWSVAKQRAANVAANAKTIQGEFDETLGEFLALIKEETPEAFDSLLLATLAEESKPANPASTGEDAGPAIDRAAELQQQWKTAPGDLWVIEGKTTHRLLCGDSTEPANVLRVMDGTKATCVFTDPPYGVSIAKKNQELNKFEGREGSSERNLRPINDDDLSPEELEKRLIPAFVNAREIAAADDCSFLVTAPQGGQLGLMMMMMMMMMQKAGLTPRHVLVWRKNCATFSMGRLDYDYQHEPILFTWVKKHKRPLAGKFKTSIWDIDKPTASKEHPTMKPVELYVEGYLNHTDAGDVIYEPYSGSGTAFVAAEQTGRHARGIELEPCYVAVILERMTKLGCKCRRVTPEPTNAHA